MVEQQKRLRGRLLVHVEKAIQPSWRSIAMLSLAVTVLLSSIKGLSQSREEAKPPPPFVPEYTDEYALKRLLKSAVGRIFRRFGFTLHAQGLRGFQDLAGPTVILDFEIVFKSKIGVEYRTEWSVFVDPYTGELEKKEYSRERFRDVETKFREMIARIKAAEASPEVREFIARHGKTKRIVGYYDYDRREEIDYFATSGKEEEDEEVEELLWPKDE